MTQIIPITSESLQARIRTLLPSQVGFGEDLQASNVIMPVIDLTAAAAGANTSELLQNAIAFGNQTAFVAQNGTQTVANTSGFYRVIGAVTGMNNSAAYEGGYFSLTDGATSKIVWAMLSFPTSATGANGMLSEQFDLVFFLRGGDSLTCTATAVGNMQGSSRQIAE